MKTFNKIFFSIFLLTIMIVAVSSCGKKTDSQKKGMLSIKGSDTMVELMGSLAENYMKQNPGSQISVTGGGSGTGIAALLNGTTDICASSRDLEAKELTQATEKNILPKTFIIANDGLAVVVHPDNPVKELTVEQIRKIFTGEYKNWKDVGGPDQPIDIYSRESSSGTYKFFQEHVLNKKDYAKEVKLMPATQAIIQAVTDSKWSIGYSGLGYTKNAKVKIVPVKKDENSPAVLPSSVTVLDKSYSIARPLYLVINGEAKDDIKKFIDFCISDTGQKLAEESGYVKIK
jgi:phosphate transport system substrate-binding protein